MGDTTERGPDNRAEQEATEEDWEAEGYQALCEMTADIQRYLDNQEEPPEGETEEDQIIECANKAGRLAANPHISQELREELEAIEATVNKLIEEAGTKKEYRPTETGQTPVTTATAITGPKQKNLERGHAKALWNMLDYLQDQKNIQLPHAIVRKACATALRMHAANNGITGTARRTTIRAQLRAGTEAGIAAIQAGEKERTCRRRALEAYEGGITMLATMLMYQRMMHAVKGQEEIQQEHEHTLPQDGEYVLQAAIQDRCSLKRKNSEEEEDETMVRKKLARSERHSCRATANAAQGKISSAKAENDASNGYLDEAIRIASKHQQKQCWAGIARHLEERRTENAWFNDAMQIQAEEGTQYSRFENNSGLWAQRATPLTQHTKDATKSDDREQSDHPDSQEEEPTEYESRAPSSGWRAGAPGSTAGRR